MNQSDNGRYHCPVPEGPVELTASAPVCSKPSLNLVQKLCGLRALNLLRRSTRIELNQVFDELLFSQAAST